MTETRKEQPEAPVAYSKVGNGGSPLNRRVDHLVSSLIHWERVGEIHNIEVPCGSKLNVAFPKLAVTESRVPAGVPTHLVVAVSDAACGAGGGRYLS